VAAIRTAQQRAHLPVTGIADKRTRISLGPLGRPLFGERTIKPGDFGLDVTVLQYLLMSHGHYRGALDGYLGARTEKALRLYQQRVHLAPDGIVGPRTRAALVLQTGVPLRTHAPRSLRRYVVRPGDSLTAIAQHFGVSLDRLAKANELDPDAVLLMGKRLEVPVPVHAALEATPSDVRDRLDTWSGRLGVSPHLVRALAWMESGFQPKIVSDAGARGVLQTLPVTRQFVEEVLVGHQMPTTVDGDIEVGVLYLRHLLREFDGDKELALAAWYQGAAAVMKHGVLEVTKPFVADVLALEARM
jgi:LysM repeat protein